MSVPAILFFGIVSVIGVFVVIAALVSSIHRWVSRNIGDCRVCLRALGVGTFSVIVKTDGSFAALLIPAHLGHVALLVVARPPVPHRDEAHLLLPLQHYPPRAVRDLVRVRQCLGAGESMRQCKENGGK